jgi:molybdate transport system substrate-binding protein
MQSLHDFMPVFHPARHAGRRHSLQVLAAAGLAAVLPPAGAQSTATKVRVLAASDLKFALARVVAPFEKQTGIKVELNFGSSGNFARQILQGLPADIFMSADEDWAFKVADAGLTLGGTADRGVVYAQGRLALIVPSASTIPLDAELRGLQTQWTQPGMRKFAIANPDLAPYGRAAQQALQKLGLWALLQPHLVVGENIAQATQFVTTGAAQAGITALSLATAREVVKDSRHIALPAHLHTPLNQRMVLLKNASAPAQQLVSYLQTEFAKDLFKSTGFDAK